MCDDRPLPCLKGERVDLYREPFGFARCFYGLCPLMPNISEIHTLAGIQKEDAPSKRSKSQRHQRPSRILGSMKAELLTLPANKEIFNCFRILICNCPVSFAHLLRKAWQSKKKGRRHISCGRRSQRPTSYLDS